MLPELRKRAEKGRVKKLSESRKPTFLDQQPFHLSPLDTPELPQSCCPGPALTRVTTLIPILSKMRLPRIRRIESPRS